MLPPIIEVAIEHGLQTNERCSSRSSKEVRFKCPFCEADANKEGKFYLSLNVADNLFKCWACGESGGVLKFIAILENISIEDVKRKLWGHKKSPHKPLHPAERLTPAQLKAIGFIGCNNLARLKKENPFYHERTLNWVWREWLLYRTRIKRLAYIGLISSMDTKEIKAICQKCAEQVGTPTEDLLFELTTLKFSRQKPEWARSAEKFVVAAQEAEKTISPDHKVTGREKEYALC